MVVEVFVSEAQSVDSLRDQLVDAVFNELGVAQIQKAFRESLDELLPLLDLTKKKTPGVRGDAPTVERTDDRSIVEGLKGKLVRATVCLHHSASPFRGKAFLAKHL